jgi:hypothetical protein
MIAGHLQAHGVGVANRNIEPGDPGHLRRHETDRTKAGYQYRIARAGATGKDGRQRDFG